MDNQDKKVIYGCGVMGHILSSPLHKINLIKVHPNPVNPKIKLILIQTLYLLTESVASPCSLYEHQDFQDNWIIKMGSFDEITYKINGCAMKVHNTLGNGFQEVIYQRCLAIELERAGLSFARELEQDIYYGGIHVGTRRADFVVENDIIVEIKAQIQLEDVHLAQAKNYVVAYDKPIGLLINFGSISLQFKKIYNPKFN